MPRKNKRNISMDELIAIRDDVINKTDNKSVTIYKVFQTEIERRTNAAKNGGRRSHAVEKVISHRNDTREDIDDSTPLIPYRAEALKGMKQILSDIEARYVKEVAVPDNYTGEIAEDLTYEIE